MEVRREVERARGKMRREKAVDEESTPDEDEDGDDDDQGADIGASLDGGLMADGRRGQEGAAKAMNEAAGSKKRKRKAKMTPIEARSPPSQPKKSRVLRQTSVLETFNPVWQRDFSNSFLQWWYVSGIPFEAARRPEYHTMRKKLLECPRYTHPALPTHNVISCDGIPQQQRVVADMVAVVRKDIEATGATILTDGRKSITSDQIVNFLAVGPTGAYLFRTVQWDGAVQETAEAVVERWKDVFDRFGVDKVNAICTDSASAYVAASKLLAQEEVKYNHITWLPCAVHVCNLLLSDMAKDGCDGNLGKREDTINRARAVVRFIREQGASLNLYRPFSVAHPSSASTAAGSCSVRYAPFWEHVEDIVELMTPVMQLLRRLERGGRLMTRMWSWGLAMVDRVAIASLNRTWKDELHIVVQACQARVAHMLELAHCMAHLLNPRHRSITFFGAAQRSEHDKTLTDESLRYLRQQTGGDKDLYQTLHTQQAEFHCREGDWTYGGVEGDRDAASWRGEEETSQRRNQLGFIKLTRLVEISTNLRLSRCQGRGSWYVLPWEDGEEETEDVIPPPRDEGVWPADRVTEAQRDRQVQRGRKDHLSKAPPSVATYFGRRATVLMATELESVYDPEPDPMAQDPMEAEPWSDPDDLAVELEPGGSDDDDDDTPLILIPRPRTRASTATAAPSPAARPPSSTPGVPLRGPVDSAEGTTPHPSADRRRHGEQRTREYVEEGDDGDYREGYEGNNEDEDDPGYSPTRRHGDDDDDDEGGDGTQPAGGLRRSERQRGDRCSSAGRGGSGPGVGGAGHTSGAGRGGGGQARRESASSTHTVHWVDEGKRTVSAEVAPSPTEVGSSPAEFAAASAEGAGGFADVGGEGVQVGRPSAQLGASFSDDIFDVSLRLPTTPAGERVTGDADAAATPVSQILRGIPSCSEGDISSSMLQEAAEGTQGSSGQHEHATGDDGECRPSQERAAELEQDRIDREEKRRAKDLASHCEMTQSIASRARAERMLETGIAAGDAQVECGGAGGGDAGERPASPIQGVCVLPLGGAMSAGELERQAREDPLQADRRGWMDEAWRRLMAEGPTYVPCSLSVPSSTTDVITPAYVEGPGAARSPTPAPAAPPAPARESSSPQSRKKKMRAGKSLSTVRRVTQTMRASQPGLAGLHPRTLASLGGDVVADAVGW
ncbi:hypothetical protein CBR_g31215 [Chara braunii]|uniref:DUF659 domain-containing protein n=1 Tax=Chara braunii TaxID=69332 RepID=A0A388JXP1_CHABU|nr:hypothetical protein CBR_g31215 [Chara braunii]|eukprot:GBG62579.1 hypothetical protein CBR_g31215 [Chara braunii]